MKNYNIPKYNFNYNFTDVLNNNNNCNNIHDSNKKYINENSNLNTNLRYKILKNNYEMKFNLNNSNNPVNKQYFYKLSNYVFSLRRSLGDLLCLS